MYPDKGDQFSAQEQAWLKGITLTDTPEGQRFHGVYHVETAEVPDVPVVATGARLDSNDFNAIFTGNFALCAQQNIRDLAERGRCFSAEVSGDLIMFLPVHEPGKVMRVYFYPVLPPESGSESTNQNVARASRLRNMKRDRAAPAQTPLPPQVLPQSCAEVESEPERRPVRRHRKRVPKTFHADEPEDHGSDPRFSRNVVLLSAAVTAAALLVRFRGEISSWFAHHYPQLDAGSQTDQGTASVEAAEKARTVKPLEVVLESSKRTFLADSKTWRDNILRRDAVTQNFLGGKFRYMDIEQGEYNGARQGLYHFAVIGEKSGQLDAKKGSERQYQSTTLPDAVNILLESGSVSPGDVKKWIVWMYERSFGLVLRPERLRLKWKEKDKLDGVFYSPAGDFNNMVGIEVVEKMDAGEEQPGGNVSKKKEPQDVLGPGNTLLLPSGISPKHDIVVPQSLMKANPEFTMKFGGTWEWHGVTAQSLSERIRSFEDRVKSKGDRRMVGTAFGRGVPIEYIAPLVDRNDALIRQLTSTLLNGIPAQNHQARITALYRFVQSLPYKTEYDTDVDRPSFITLFNGGGDCNNLTILFNELMLAAGYDTAIMWVAFNKNHYVTHTRGGIPARYFPGTRAWTNGPKKWVPIELAGKQFFTPGMDAFGSDESTFYIEEMER